MSPPPRLIERLARSLAEPAAAWQAAVTLLAELRPMDPAGAAVVLEREPGLARLVAQGPAAAAELAARLLELARARRCVGCGTCCLTSSPTLYAEDLERIGGKGLPRQALFALRPGERVFSAREGASRLLEGELIKLREQRDKRGCLFLANGRCGIYDSRPLQCRVLECWSGRHAGELEGRPRLTRADLFAGDQVALELIAEYDLKLPAGRLGRALEAAAAGDRQAADQALSLMELDHNLRQGAGRRYGYTSQELELMWGRPALVVAGDHGLEVALDQAGRPVLRRRKGPAPPAPPVPLS